MTKTEPRCWVFSNKPAGSYAGNIWGTTLKTKRYYFKENEKSRRRVKVGDAVFLRTGVGYVGRFEAVGMMRRLKPRQQTRVKSIRAEQGIRAAIAGARRMAG